VLVRALIARAPELRDVEIVHMMTLGSADYVKPEMEGHFRHNAIFIGPNVREAVNEGRADYTPVFLGEVEALFEDGTLALDVALVQVSPPDAHGFCSLGVGVDTTLTAAKKARHVLAEVNDQMPRTYGDSFLHVNDFEAMVDASHPLCELPRADIRDVHRAIARNVAALVDDGSTLQLGVGGLPDAVLPELLDRRDLGVHTEMVSDNVIPLIEAGVINGKRKTVHPRKIILGFMLGSKELFDYVDENPIFEFHPTSYTNDPSLIRQNDRMVAINSALEVDLTGQVCADSLGTYFYSGIGGQVDFLRGAAGSRGGKPIIALPATAKAGKISRIVPVLTTGAGVVTSRGLTHYVVTEFGIASLHGKTVRERAEALIQIAHPDFREQLYSYCERTRWLQRPMAVSRGRA
jgi:acyl-CoA hydrolase